MKFRNFIVLFILVFGISTLSIANIQKTIKWEFSSEEWEGLRIASAEFIGFSYDEVWGKVFDVLLFKKFAPWGKQIKVRHEIVTVEKDSGLVVVRGMINESVSLSYYSGSEDYKYIFKVMIQEIDGQIVMKCRCDGPRKSEVIKEFFQLFEKDDK